MNVNKIKKWGAFFICGIIPAISLTLLLATTPDIIIIIMGFVFSIFISIIIGSMLTKHPLTQMIEGEGMLVFDMVSTGVLRLFLVKIIPPNVKGKLGKEQVSSLFSRNIVSYFRGPFTGGTATKTITETGEEKLVIELPKVDETKSIFGMGNYIVLFFNSQLKSFLSKESLGNFEERAFVHHTVLDLNKNVNTLGEEIRPFAAYVMDKLMPKKSIFDSPLFVIAIIIVVIIIIVLAAPAVLNYLGKVGILEAGSASPVTTVIPAQAVTPSSFPLIPT